MTANSGSENSKKTTPKKTTTSKTGTTKPKTAKTGTKTGSTTSTRKKTTGKGTGSSKTAGRKTTSKTNRKAEKKGCAFRLVLVSMVLIALILVGVILTLDQQAMKKGQVGLWESITGIRPARTAADVESLTESVLADFGVDKSNLRQTGYTVVKARDNEKLRQLVYHIHDRDTLSRIISEFEDKARKKGVKVHNRHVVKQPRKWVVTFYLGTHGTRTHKLDIHFTKPVDPPVEQPTEEPAPAIEPTPTEAVKTSPEPTRKPTSGSPRIALIFDDFGQDKKIAERFLNELTVPITLAIIPYQNYSSEIIDMTRKAGQTAFLHMPMEPVNSAAMGTDADIFLTTQMDDTTLRSKTARMLSDCKGVHGVNNHTGSKLTQDRHRMSIIMSEIKKHNIVFVDSRTIASTVAETVAREAGIPTASRKIFLDQGYAGGNVTENMQKLIEAAREDGFAIGIGHAIDKTLEQVVAALPSVQENGVEIVDVRSLTR